MTVGGEIYEGDCLDLIKRLPDASIDSLVCDPPASIGFMNAKWDSDKGGRKQWCAYMEERFAEALRVCKPGAHALVWALPRTSHWTAIALEDAGWEIRDICCHLFGAGFPKSLDIGKKLNSKKWDGWGSGLKPSHENWILCRKPVEGTIAQNVLTHGVGGIDIDGCRVEYASDYDKKHQEDIARGQERATNGRMFGSSTTRSEASSLVMKGRWPSNLVFSHLPECTESACANGCAVAELDEQSMNQSCAASRYFPVFHYFPKASPNDRSCNKTVENSHPTVKNRDLMRWLVRLITPSGGTVLDMFGGSGSTAIACIEEGFSYILLEQEPEFVAIAKARVAAVIAKAKLSEPEKSAGQLSFLEIVK
jgi:site-specific DNA-methyltransferase (adenine-specific)